MYFVQSYQINFNTLFADDFRNMKKMSAALQELRTVKATSNFNPSNLTTLYNSYRDHIRRYRATLKHKPNNEKYLCRKINGRVLSAKIRMRSKDSIETAKAQLKQQVREYRDGNKRLYRDRRIHELSSGLVINSYHVAGVHMEAGFWERQLHLRQVQDVFRNKRPTNNDNYLGIELEFFCDSDRDTLAYNLYKAGLRRYVHLKSDGSIRPRTSSQYAHELCVLVPEGARNTVIKKVCQVLRIANAEVNKTCGMHVHIDMRNRDREVVFHNLVSSQSILYAMNPRSRLQASPNGTIYCKRTRTKKFNTRMDRYHGINPRAYTEHQTIEVRIHAGTISSEKIIGWLDILVAIAGRRTKVEKTRRSIRSFAQDYGINGTIQAYIKDRIDKFKVRKEEAEAA